MKKTKKCRAFLVDAPGGDIRHKLWFSTRLDYLHYANCKNDLSGFNPKQIVLISLDPDEKIVVGDLVTDGVDLCRITNIENKFYSIESFDKKINIENKSISLLKGLVKVIATQEQISLDYMGEFIDDYNNKILKNIEIEMEEDIAEYVGPFNPNAKKYKPKLTNGFVNIVTKSDLILETIGDTSDDCSDPQPQILYTEEDVLKILNKFREDFPIYRGIQILDNMLNDWFFINKKK